MQLTHGDICTVLTPAQHCGVLAALLESSLVQVDDYLITDAVCGIRPANEDERTAMIVSAYNEAMRSHGSERLIGQSA